MRSNEDSEEETPDTLSRRDFLRHSVRTGAMAGLSIPLLSANAALADPLRPAKPKEPQIKQRNRLGSTGLVVPDISFGSWALKGDDSIVRHALDRGVTHFDTARDYGKGEAELSLGRALKGDRPRVTIATKYAVRAHEDADDMMANLEKSLRRLQTDYVDIFINHAVNDLERARNPEWLKFTARAKEQGKMRACGFSGHAGNLAECIDVALDERLVDCILVAHNYASMPGFWEMGLRLKDRFTGGFDFVAYQSEIPRLLAKAKKKGVGTLVMKTRRGARYNDLSRFQQDGASFEQAAFRWVLSDPNVDGLVVTMGSHEAVDRFVAASGWRPPSTADTRRLLEYERVNEGQLCQQGCGDCASACPAGVDIAEVLRTRMYDVDYREPELARAEYARLERSASACLACVDQACQAACPSGLDLPSMTREAHARLGSQV